ncbi:hypothetical protein PPERSA_03338 [Pseudocohnilembus persalinus]|uniref:Transmembrane protein n=1 Tax=Pseudocohnilembus persalinus TaxID=266149 RepID=A0A0V0R2D5_PSEPJ|nr:hypothetical protein PPERSA_03338 [Pseudocohnilembus persalinus]|eukprot:KRX08344.1 hypothetical protein PPERSA_03338 [Pseudocohnilembus persalinus]
MDIQNVQLYQQCSQYVSPGSQAVIIAITIIGMLVMAIYWSIDFVYNKKRRSILEKQKQIKDQKLKIDEAKKKLIQIHQNNAYKTSEEDLFNNSFDFDNGSQNNQLMSQILGKSKQQII